MKRSGFNLAAGFLYGVVMAFMCIAAFVYKHVIVPMDQWRACWAVIAGLFVAASVLLVYGSSLWAAMKAVGRKMRRKPKK